MLFRSCFNSGGEPHVDIERACLVRPEPKRRYASVGGAVAPAGAGLQVLLPWSRVQKCAHFCTWARSRGPHFFVQKKRGRTGPQSGGARLFDMSKRRAPAPKKLTTHLWAIVNGPASRRGLSERFFLYLHFSVGTNWAH